MKYLMLVLAVFVTGTYAQNNVDLSNADLGGVRLGMTADEAIAAATKSTGVKAPTVKPLLFPNPVTGKSEVNNFSVRNDKVEIRVGLIPAVDQDGRNRVASITYEVPWSEENMKALVDSANQKFGQHSTGRAASIQWCKQPGEISGVLTCHRMDMNQPLVQLVSSGLELTDPGRYASFRRWQTQQRAVKPKL